MTDSESTTAASLRDWSATQSIASKGADTDVENRVRYDQAVRSGQADEQFAAEDPEFARTVRLLNDALTIDLPQSAVALADASKTRVLSDDESTVPQFLGRFEIQAKIDSGAFGIVWRAWDPLLQRMVAVKVPRPEIRMDVEVSRRFLREARAAARLNHPGIVRVLDAGTADGIPYLAADYVEGGSLGQLLQRVERLPVREAASLVRSLADAVAHAHQNGILHRDIKPENVLMEVSSESESSQERVPRLTDFGLARITDDDGGRSRFGLIIGTPNYMAPEQLTGRNDQHGKATDVFSLGVVFYKILIGRIPNDQAGSVDVLVQAASRKFASLRRQRPEIPHDLESICLKCVEREPQNRYQTADDLRADLDRFLAGQPTIARPLPIYERLLRWGRDNKTMATAFTVVLMSLIMVAAVSWKSSNFERSQNALLQAALEEKKAQSERVRQNEQRFRKLAWNAGLKQGYALFQDGDFISTQNTLDQLKESHPGAPQRPEWKLLQLELNNQVRVIHTVKGQLDEVVRLPNSSRVVVGGSESELRIIDTDSGTQQQINTEVDGIHALAVSRDGTQLAFGGTPNSPNGFCPVIVNLKTMEQRTLTMDGPTTIESLAFSPDSRRLAVGHRDQPVSVIPMDPRTASDDVQLKGDRRNYSIAWFDDSRGPEVLITSLAWTVLQITTATGEFLDDIHREPECQLFCVVPGTRELVHAVNGEDAHVEVLNLSNGHSYVYLHGRSGTIRSVACSDDGRWVAAGYEHGWVAVWDMNQCDEEQDEKLQHLDQFDAVRLHEGYVDSMCWVGSRLITVGGDGRAVEFDVLSTAATQQGYLHRARAVCFVGDSEDVLLGLWDGVVLRMTAKELQDLCRDMAAVTDPPLHWTELPHRIALNSTMGSLASTRDGRLFAVGNLRGRVRIFQTADGRKLWDIQCAEELPSGHGVHALEFSQSADRLYWVDNHRIHCQFLTGTKRALQSDDISCESMLLSPDESWIDVVDSAEGVFRYDAEDLHQLPQNACAQGCGAIARFEDMLLTGQEDGTIRGYDNTTREELGVMKVHSGPVVDTKLFHNSSTGISIDMDSRIHIWDHVAGTVFGSITRKSGRRECTDFHDLAISRNNRWLITLTQQPYAPENELSVRVYDLAGPE